MSVRNLDAIFRPRSIALIGASIRESSAGRVIMENLLSGGFRGPIVPVNPKYKTISGVAAYADVASLPFAPDLAVIATPPPTVPSLIMELAKRGTRGAIVITAGFGELGSEEGRRLQGEMLAQAQPHLLRIVGPNCLGVLSTPVCLNASFAPGQAKPGGVAFVAQSGAMLATVLDWANARGIGFSHLVSLGDMADVDFGDMLDYLATDPSTSAVLLYIEAITAPRKFLSAARAAARLKPVIAIKAGRSEAAAKAAHSHTGALAGQDAAYDAALKRAGILRVHDLEELFDAVATLAYPLHAVHDDMVIVTNGGGAGVLATDALIEAGGHLTELSPDTLAKLDAVLPRTWSRANPVDIIGDAGPDRYASAMKIVLSAPETSAVLAINCPTAIASSVDAAAAVAAAAANNNKTVLANWLGAQSAGAARTHFHAAHVPAYDTPDEAVRGFMHLARYCKGQQVIAEVPPSVATDFAPDENTARAVIAAALARGEGWLNAIDAARVLGCYRIPIARAVLAASPAEVRKAAERFHTPVAVKIASPDIVHKSDAGGVMLGLESPDLAEAAAARMQQRIAESLPAARIEGFLVQEMIQRPGAYELIAGASVDSQFGPVILFGQGGTAAEIIADRALALPPLNLRLAQELIGQTRIARQLKGYRDRPPAAMEEIAVTLVKLSQLICDLDEVIELDLNPLLADASGVIAVDARVRIQHAEQNRGARLAIRPYPRDLERKLPSQSGEPMTLRPIRPGDAGALAEMIAALTPEDARLRFFTPVRNLESSALARFTQIDYDREMAFVLYGDAAPSRLLGVVRLAADPDNVKAEFAIVVRSDCHRRGLGRLLMRELIDYARARGLLFLVGDILAENGAMIALCTQLGFRFERTESSDVVRAVLPLPARA